MFECFVLQKPARKWAEKTKCVMLGDEVKLSFLKTYFIVTLQLHENITFSLQDLIL